MTHENISPERQFQIGDLVELKSGSPLWTVTAFSEGRLFVCRCDQHDHYAIVQLALDEKCFKVHVPPANYDSDGFNRDGFNRDGFNRDGYDRNGYDSDGYDRDGFNRDGYDINHKSR